MARRRRENPQLPARRIAGDAAGEEARRLGVEIEGDAREPARDPHSDRLQQRLLQRPDREKALAARLVAERAQRRGLRRREEPRRERQRIHAAIARLDVDPDRGAARDRARGEPVGMREVEAERAGLGRRVDLRLAARADAERDPARVDRRGARDAVRASACASTKWSRADASRIRAARSRSGADRTASQAVRSASLSIASGVASSTRTRSARTGARCTRRRRAVKPGRAW